MLTPTEAARHILAQCAPLSPRRLPLKDTLDLVLAEDVASPIDLPPWDNAAMDGYAARSADVRGASRDHPVVLRIIELVAAGQFPTRAVAAGQTTRIFTGAPLPEGVDCVIRQEDTTGRADDRVAIHDDRDAGANLRARGGDVGRGTVVATRGAMLGPAQLGVLAAIAHAEPLVHPAPRVAFLGSGDEIVDLDQAPAILAGRKIASSNSYTLHGMIRRAGGTPIDLGIARDTRESLRERLSGFVPAAADMLVTTAGVSVGEHDLMRDVLQELGCEIQLSRVRMRPGAPLVFGVWQGKPWIGLPGNPVSAMVTFELFARPAIRRLAGAPLPFRRTVPVRVAEAVRLGPPLRHFLRVIVEPDAQGALTARLTGPQGSGMLTSMARANALLIVPEDCAAVAPGTVLAALLLDDPHHVAQPPF